MPAGSSTGALIWGDISVLAVGTLIAITVLIIAVTYSGARYFSSSVTAAAVTRSPGIYAPADLVAARGAVARRAMAL